VSRKDDARRFAAAMGWTVDRRQDGETQFEVPRLTMDGVRGHATMWNLPPADAPLPRHLAFVGRVAEALDLPVRFDSISNGTFGVAYYTRETEMPDESSRSDPSWAAMLAAIAARGER